MSNLVYDGLDFFILLSSVGELSLPRSNIEREPGHRVIKLGVDGHDIRQQEFLEQEFYGLDSN